MIPLRRAVLPQLFKVSDLVTFVAAFLVATITVFPQFYPRSLRGFLAMRISVLNVVLLIGLVVLLHVVCLAVGVYDLDRLRRRSQEMAALGTATTVGTVVLFFVSVIFDIAVVTGGFLAVFWAVSFSALVVGRMVLRAIIASKRLNGRSLRHLLIVGTNERAVQFGKKIQEEPDLGYRLVGFVEDGWEGKSRAFGGAGFAVKTVLPELPTFLQEQIVDEVLICLPVKSYYTEISDIIRKCEEHGIIVRLSSDFFSLKLARSRAERFGTATVVTIYTGAMTGFPVVLKRLLDLCVASVALAACAPVFLIIAILIKATSRGPVFFAQNRVGLNKRRFAMYKFRTMVPDAEAQQRDIEHLNDVSGPVFKVKDDPRVTKIGKLLRRMSLDELPQIINVLRGDMSLVGPRPLPIRDYEGFEEDWHRRRFSVRPGMTCLWQVSGRSDIPFERWMELDLEYIDRWSLWLDLKILGRTVPAVFRKVGAV